MQAEDVGPVEQIARHLQSKHGRDLLLAIATEFAELRQRYTELAEAVDELQTLESFSGLIRSIDLLEGGPRLPRRAEIGAHDFLEPQEGFYPLEHDSSGTPFRWTGPLRHFSFLVCVDRSVSLLVRLELVFAFNELRQRHMALLVDGTSLPISLERDGPGLCGQVLLPPRAGMERTRLTFVLAEVGQPAENDTRLLGVAFRRLVVEPGPMSSFDTDESGRFELEQAAESYARRYPTEAVVRADEIAANHPGFFDLETDASGRQFRWTGRQAMFSLDALVDRSHALEVRLRLVSAVDVARQSPLRLEVDDQLHDCPIRVVGSLLEASAVLPPRSRIGKTHLTFAVPTLLQPNGDCRHLGVAFHTLQLCQIVDSPPDRDAPTPLQHETHVQSSQSHGGRRARPARRRTIEKAGHDK